MRADSLRVQLKRPTAAPQGSSGLQRGAAERIAPPIVHEVLRSRGEPLDPGTRDSMETRFGHDFSQVRVLADARAAESAKAVNSLAFTVGRQVVFAKGRYAPHTPEGTRLLAHELTHTIQQSGVAAPDQPLCIEPPGTSLERAAEDRSARLTNSSSALAPIHRIALQRQPAPAPEIEMPAEWAFAHDTRKRTDKRYARSEAQKDAARIRKKVTLSSEDREEVTAKLQFFEGEAWEVYGQVIRPALVDVMHPEIQMPGEYGELLEAIVTIMECAPVSSRESPIEKNPVAEDSRCGPAYYAKRGVSKKEHVDLLGEWFRVANIWSQTTTSYRSPDPAFVLSGAAGLDQIAHATAQTSSILAHASAAGNQDIIARYQTMVATFSQRARFKASRETETKVSDEVHKMEWTEISRQWATRKNDFLTVASKYNLLNSHQLFKIWVEYWSEQYHDAWVADDNARHKLWEENAVEFANGMYDFEHNAMRDALGPEYRKVRDHFDTVAFLFSMPPEKMLAWLEDIVDTSGVHLTLQQVNDHAREFAEAQGGWGGVFQQMAMGFTGGGPMRPPAPPTVRRGMITYPTAATANVRESATTPTPPRPIGYELPHNPPSTPAPVPVAEPQILTFIKPSRPVSGFARPLAPDPALVPLTPGQTVFTEMPKARVVQGNQPIRGNVKPAVETPGETPGTPSRPVKGFQKPAKDVAEKGLIEVDIGPREYVKKEYFGDVGAAGEQQSRYHVNIRLDEHGMMDADFVLRGGGRRSGSLLGKEEFLEAKRHFEQAGGSGSVKGVRGSWGGGDNLETFNARYKEAKGKGLSDDAAMSEAARKTKTGEWAAEAGFKNVKVTKAEGTPGAYTNVEVEFTK